jgi:rhomboid protease GluP
MENSFIKKIKLKSHSDLQYIIDNKNNYQEEAYITAIQELELRNLAPKNLSQEKNNILEQRIQLKKGLEKEEVEKKVESKKILKETLDLLKPSKDYFYTPIIVYLNILIFIIMVLSGVHPIAPSVESLILWGGNLREITFAGQQWRLLTNIFVHGGLIHLLMNMYALLYIGGLLESKFGKNKYLLAYLSTGLFASIASISFYDNIVSIGASGAIFGMYGIFLSLIVLKGIELPKDSKKNLLISILFFIGYNLFYGLTNEGIDNAAHIGGLVSGFIIGFAFYPSIRNPRYTKHISISIGIILLITIFTIPKLFNNKLVEFQSKMEVFITNEEKALWVYSEDLTYIPPNKTQFYYNKLRTQGINLWEDNLKLLNTLSDLPPYLQIRVDLLREYCNLRIEAYKTIQDLLQLDRESDQVKIEEINQKIEKKIQELQAINEQN